MQKKKIGFAQCNPPNFDQNHAKVTRIIYPEKNCIPSTGDQKKIYAKTAKNNLIYFSANVLAPITIFNLEINSAKSQKLYNESPRARLPRTNCVYVPTYILLLYTRDIPPKIYICVEKAKSRAYYCEKYI